MNWMSEFGRVGPCWKGFPNFALNKVHRPTLVTASSLQRDVTILQECVRQVSFAYSSPQQIPSNMLHLFTLHLQRLQSIVQFFRVFGANVLLIADRFCNSHAQINMYILRIRIPPFPVWIGFLLIRLPRRCVLAVCFARFAFYNFVSGCVRIAGLLGGG